MKNNKGFRTNTTRAEDGTTPCLAIDAALPKEVLSFLSQASGLLEHVEQQISSARHSGQVKEALYQLQQIKGLQKAAIKYITTFHEEALSRLFDTYNTRIDTLQQGTIANTKLSEKDKTSLLTRSAHSLEREKYIIARVKHTVRDFRIQIQNLTTANESVSDTISKNTANLCNAPAQPDKLPAIKSYAAALLQAEKCLFTIIQNELERGHYTIANAYNSTVDTSKPYSTFSFFQGNYFNVPPLTHSLLEESKAYIQNAEKLDTTYHVTASSLLSYIENILQRQRPTLTMMGKSGEQHLKEFQNTTRTTLVAGIKQLSQMTSGLQHTQLNTSQTIPGLPSSITALLRATYALEKAVSYAAEIQSSHPNHAVLTKQKLKTMQQLLNHQQGTLLDAQHAVATNIAMLIPVARSMTERISSMCKALTHFITSCFSSRQPLVSPSPPIQSPLHSTDNQALNKWPALSSKEAKQILDTMENPFNGDTFLSSHEEILPISYTETLLNKRDQQHASNTNQRIQA